MQINVFVSMQISSNGIVSLVLTSAWVLGIEFNADPEHDQDNCDSLHFYELNFHSIQSLRDERQIFRTSVIQKKAAVWKLI